MNDFCIFCREPDKKTLKSHIIPLSVLKCAGEKVHSIGPTGREVSHSDLVYKGYCKPCEDIFNIEGEQYFNPLLHKPLILDHNCEISISDKTEVAGIVHCAISIWWRVASLTELASAESPEGKKLRQLLEVVRLWLRKPTKAMPGGLVVCFTAMNQTNLSFLKEHGLDGDATRLYTALDGPNGYVNRLLLGPVWCKFLFEQKLYRVSSFLEIPEGDQRPIEDRREVVLFIMSTLKFTWNIEARARARPKSREQPIVIEVPNPIMIPAQIAIVEKETVTPRSYIRWIREETCKTTAGDVQLVLYTPKKDYEPPYNAVATVLCGSRKILIWLKSDSSGKTFHLPVGTEALAPYHLDPTELEGLTGIIADLKLS